MGAGAARGLRPSTTGGREEGFFVHAGAGDQQDLHQQARQTQGPGSSGDARVFSARIMHLWQETPSITSLELQVDQAVKCATTPPSIPPQSDKEQAERHQDSQATYDEEDARDIQPLAYFPGQWVDVYIPDVHVVGGFSFTSSPLHTYKTDVFSISVKQSAHPPAQWMHRCARIGQHICVRHGGGAHWPPRRSLLQQGVDLPAGCVAPSLPMLVHFLSGQSHIGGVEARFDPLTMDMTGECLNLPSIRNAMNRSVVLIAGGIGIAPMLSILRTICDLWEIAEQQQKQEPQHQQSPSQQRSSPVETIGADDDTEAALQAPTASRSSASSPTSKSPRSAASGAGSNSDAASRDGSGTDRSSRIGGGGGGSASIPSTGEPLPTPLRVHLLYSSRTLQEFAFRTTITRLVARFPDRLGVDFFVTGCESPNRTDLGMEDHGGLDAGPPMPNLPGTTDGSSNALSIDIDEDYPDLPSPDKDRLDVESLPHEEAISHKLRWFGRRMTKYDLQRIAYSIKQAATAEAARVGRAAGLNACGSGSARAKEHAAGALFPLSYGGISRSTSQGVGDRMGTSASGTAQAELAVELNEEGNPSAQTRTVTKGGSGDGDDEQKDSPATGRGGGIAASTPFAGSATPDQTPTSTRANPGLTPASSLAPSSTSGGQGPRTRVSATSLQRLARDNLETNKTLASRFGTSGDACSDTAAVASQAGSRAPTSSGVAVWYVCAPAGLTDATVETLHDIGVPEDSIEVERWW